MILNLALILVIMSLLAEKILDISLYNEYMHNLTIPLITLIMNIPKENLMKDFKKILMDIILVVRKKIKKE